MFADPSRSGPFGPSLLHYRAGIGIGTGDCIRYQTAHGLFELYESIAEDFVVIPAPRIARDAAITGPFIGAMLAGPIVFVAGAAMHRFLVGRVSGLRSGAGEVREHARACGSTRRR